MREYPLMFARSARQELERLDTKVVERIWRKIEALAGTPRPRGCRKLSGTKNVWRIRIGDYRTVYAVDDAARTVDIIAVRHRRDAYT